jgi:hypothetical protein
MKMHERRPMLRRVRDFLTVLPGSIRKVPGVPAATVAVVLGLAIGVGIVNLSGLHLGGGLSTAGRPSSFPEASARNNAPKPSSQFSGPLPSPALDQPNSSFPTRTINGGAYNASYSLYFGPTTLTWAGKLDVTGTNLPVYRFQEPTRADAVRFAASIGASPAPQLPQEGLGTFAGHNLVLVIAGSTRLPDREPTFRFNDPCDAHKVRRWPLKSESWGLERSWQVIRADHEPRGGRRRAELRRARVLGGEAEQLSLAHDRTGRRRWPWIGCNEIESHVGSTVVVVVQPEVE